MPTNRRRHAITETPPVQEALDELRAALGTDRLPLGEILILGAQTRVAQLRNGTDEKAALRKRAADRIRERRPLGIDLEAAEEVRRSGWVHSL